MYDLSSGIWVSSDWKRVVLEKNSIFGSGLGWRRIVVILGMVWRRETDMEQVLCSGGAAAYPLPWG